MPRDTSILGLNGYRITGVSGGNVVYIAASYTRRIACPFCGGAHLRCKDRYVRELRHGSMGLRPCYLRLTGHKYHCRTCGRYFNQRFPGVQPWRRSTETFRRQVFTDHMDGICSKTLAERERIGSVTVGRWHHDFLKRKITERQLGRCPEVLGMDEHFFTRRQGYATTLCDLERHRVYDIVLGRSEPSLAGFFGRLLGRDRVRIVCIDLSSTYRSIVRRYFPNARIVADRFHVIRLVNHHFLATWRTLDPVSSKNRGLLSLMRRHSDRISPEQQTRLSSYFGSRPEIGAIYGFKQELCGMFRRKTCSRKTCQRMIPRLLALVEQLRDCGLENLVILGSTLADWIEEMVCMWRYTKNNGITEGFHNKMKMIVRRAYGFRNFENYRLRVRALCS